MAAGGGATSRLGRRVLGGSRETRDRARRGQAGQDTTGAGVALLHSKHLPRDHAVRFTMPETVTRNRGVSEESSPWWKSNRSAAARSGWTASEVTYSGRTRKEMRTRGPTGKTVPIVAKAAPGHGDPPRRHTRPVSAGREPRGQPKRSVAMPLEASSSLRTFKMKTSQSILRVKKITRSSAGPAGGPVASPPHRPGRVCLPARRRGLAWCPHVLKGEHLRPPRGL